MNSGQARTRLVQAGAALAAAALIAGCGSTYRPVVTPVNPSGPAAATSVVCGGGLGAFADHAGHCHRHRLLRRLRCWRIAPIGVGPLTFTIDETGATGYTINSDGTLSNFPISSSSAGQAGYLHHASFRRPMPVNLFSPSAGLWAADLNGQRCRCVHGVPRGIQAGHSGGADPDGDRGARLCQGSATSPSAQGATANGRGPATVSPTTATHRRSRRH